jgi:ankyrin repeat protein
MIRAILGRGDVDVNEADACGETVLHKAALSGCGEVVRLLMGDRRVDVNAVTRKGSTALHHALAGKHAALAAEIAACPAVNVNARSARCASPINVAISENMIGVVRVLCGRGDLDVTGEVKVKNGWAPLAIAAHRGSVEAIELLLECPAMRSDCDKCGLKIALAFAIKMGFGECVRILDSRRKSVSPVVEEKCCEKGGAVKRVRRRRRSSNVG